MFVSEKFVFIELHKTGCTHILHILGELLDGELIGKHNQASPNLFINGRVFLGSIRDPWEWYTSLWAYGCDKKGLLFHRVTLGSKDRKKWIDTYRDVNDANAFRIWLSMMHDTKYINDIGEGYSNCSVNRFCGLMTFRFLNLFCTKVGEREKLNELSSFEQSKNYEGRNCFINHFIRNENLEADLFNGLENFGQPISNEIKSTVMSKSRTNTSSRKHGPGYYYDIASEQLIAQRERVIIDKFKYQAPSLRAVA